MLPKDSFFLSCLYCKLATFPTAKMAWFNKSTVDVLDDDTFYRTCIRATGYSWSNPAKRGRGCGCISPARGCSWQGPSRTWAAKSKQRLVVLLLKSPSDANRSWIILPHWMPPRRSLRVRCYAGKFCSSLKKRSAGDLFQDAKDKLEKITETSRARGQMTIEWVCLSLNVTADKVIATG